MSFARAQEFKFICAVLFLLVVYVWLSGATQAFGNTTLIAQAELPTESEALLDERAQLETLYKSQIEKYRTSERQYFLDKQQYLQLQTLVSLEVAVRSTREVYLDRTKVLVTYIELVRLELQDTPGIELGAKERAITILDDAREAVLHHQDDILLSEDRVALGTRANEFASLSPVITDATYRALLLVNMGRVQTIFDQSELLFADILQYHADNPGSALQESQRTRARQEIERNLGSAESNLREVSAEYVALEEDSKAINRNIFNRTSGDLSTPFSQLSNILSFLAEFITI